MPNNDVLTKENFDEMLLWFSTDRETAGAKYEEIRNGLVRYFDFKGCADAEALADETINRVARKFTSFDTNNNHKHITYFYGFASKVFLEYLKKAENKSEELSDNFKLIEDKFGNEEIETKHNCLDKCLNKLSDEDKAMAIGYFGKEKSEKFEHRRQIAKRMNITIGNLHVKVYRLKATLKNCIEKCAKNNL